MPEEKPRLSYRLMFGNQELHSAEIETRKLEKNEPINIGRQPNCFISLAHMIEDAQNEQRVPAATLKEAMKHVDLVSRQHLMLTKHSNRPGWVVTSVGSNDLPQISYSKISGENASHPLAQEQQVANVDITKPFSITFPKPSADAKKDLVLVFKITGTISPTH
ncbi:hypothetical protein H0O03_01095 [Candidatus Micrarchaeota archaeon]|nr:hypothetical protein [Candidatus Micrarchaeota archaeon]